MQKDYTNKNKKFFENGKQFKEFEVDCILLIYILNNLDLYISFVNTLKKEKKDRATPIASRHSLLGYFYMYLPTEIFLEENIELIKNFFFKMEKNSFSSDIVFKERTLKFLKFCIDEENFSKDFFIDYFCKQCKKNIELKKNRQKIDFDSLLVLSIEYPKLLDLDICSKKTRQELIDIVNYIKE